MKEKYTEHISRLEALADEKNRLLKDFSSLCMVTLKTLECGDIEAFSARLDERRILIERLSALSGEFYAIRERLCGGLGTIIAELTKPGAENMVCPDWCKPLQNKYFETRRLIKTCAALDSRINAQAALFREKLLCNMTRIRNRQKIRSGYCHTGKSAAQYGQTG